MSWIALIYVMVILVGLLGLLFMYVWPREADGSFMDPEEVDKFLKKIPPAPLNSRTKMVLIGVFATLAMIGMALTNTNDLNDDETRHE